MGLGQIHTYKYTGVDQYGKPVKGKADATSRTICMRFLEARKIVVQKLEESNDIFSKLANISFGAVVTPKILVFYLKQLGSLLTAGVKLVEALEILATQQDNKQVRKILFAIQQEVYNGNKLSSAFAMFPADFPGLLISMTEAGEASGDLGNTIVNAAEHFENTQKINAQIVGTVRSPIIYLAITFVIAVAMLMFVFPMIQGMFDAFDGAELPIVTVIFLKASDILQKYWLIVFGTLFVLIVTFVICYKKIPKFYRLCSIALLKTPLIGGLVQMNNQILIANTLSQLLGRGVNSVNALAIVKKVTKSPIYVEIIENASNYVQDGKGFARAFEESWAIDPIMSRMISTGEKTSEIPKLMKNLSKYYQDITDARITNVRGALQPILMLFVYAVVGSLLLAIMLPQLTLGSQVDM